jgi:hypothetical protein
MNKSSLSLKSLLPLSKQTRPPLALKRKKEDRVKGKKPSSVIQVPPRNMIRLIEERL